MTWIASELNKKIEIQISVNTPNSEGGYTREYVTLARPWAKVTTITKSITSLETRQQHIRNQQTVLKPTHEFTIRADVVRSIEKFDPVKSEYFILMHKGYHNYKRFRILSPSNPNETNELVVIQARLEVSEGDCFA